MDMNLILASIGVFLVVVLLLVVILLVAKNFLVPSGNVKLTINGEKELEVASGSTLLNTLSVNGIFLSSACGGKGSCGQAETADGRNCYSHPGLQGQYASGGRGSGSH